WVLAKVYRQSGTSFVVVHWNGRTWRRVAPGSAGYYLPTAVSDGHGGWWSVPYRADQPVRYLLHRAHGRWTRFSLPVPLLVYLGAISSSFDMIHVPHTDTMLV